MPIFGTQCLYAALIVRALNQILNHWREANAESMALINASASEKEGKWIEDLITQIQQKDKELYLFMSDDALWQLQREGYALS
jgi:hypothetical protein